MLKFKKSSKTNDIIICLREKDRYFNKSLVLAFSIALALHLGALILFHIQPFKITSSFIFSPVTVDINLPKGSEMDLIRFPTLREAVSNVGKPPHPIPMMPSFPHLMPKQSTFTSANSTKILHFSTLEDVKIADEPATLSKLSNIPYSPIRVSISGPLALQPLVNESYDLISMLQQIQWIKETGSLVYFHLKYLIQIEPQSGAIFWLDKKESSGSLELDLLVEKLLQKLRFEPSLVWNNLIGEIEFLLTLDGSKRTENLKEILGAESMLSNQHHNLN